MGMYIVYKYYNSSGCFKKELDLQYYGNWNSSTNYSYKLTSTWMVTSRGDVESWLLFNSGSGLWSGALYTSTKSVGITAITNITPVTTITNITTLLAWALMNGKSSEYKERFWKIREEKLFCRFFACNILQFWLIFLVHFYLDGMNISCSHKHYVWHQYSKTPIYRGDFLTLNRA